MARQDLTQYPSQQPLSDHAPFKVDIKFNGNGQITLLSWTMYDLENCFSSDEEIAKLDERYKAIAASLKRMVEKHHPDFICLQEITASFPTIEAALYQVIQAALGDRYDSVKLSSGRVVESNDCITLYNTQRFQPTVTPCGHREGCVTQFTEKSSQRTVRILNIHHERNTTPRIPEKTVEAFLGKNDWSSALSFTSNVSIVVGDLGFTVAPVNDVTPRNILTSVDGGARATAGCFYTLNGQQFFQSDISPLNPNTGEKFTLSELEARKIPDGPKQAPVRQEILEQRMLMCVDDIYRTKPLIAGQTVFEAGQTVFEYEKYLQDRLNNTEIIVRPTRDLNNTPGIGIVLPIKLSNAFFHSDSQNPSLFKQNIWREAFGLDHLIFITMTLDKLNQFVEKMNAFLPPLLQRSASMSLFRFFNSSASIESSKELGYQYQENGKTVTLSINRDYPYAYIDFKDIWYPRLNLLKKWLEKQKIKIKNPKDIVMPEEQILWNDSLGTNLKIFLKKEDKIGSSNGQQFFFVPLQIKGVWSTLIVAYTKRKKQKSVFAYGIGPLEDGATYIRGAMVSAFSSNTSEVPNFPFHIHSYYTHTNPASSGPLAIENAIQIIKNILAPNRFKLGPEPCDKNAMVILRGDHLRILGGTKARLYPIQYANKKEDQAASVTPTGRQARN